MRVVCPHAGPVPEPVRAALDATGRPWDAADVSASDIAYTRLLQTLWARGESFVIVEHDIVIRPGVLDEFEDCPHSWCAFTYRLRDADVAGLGCTRFRAGLIANHHGALEATWREQSAAHPAGHWCNLDDRLTRVLTAAGITRHVHQPPVEHLNPAPTHDCI